MIIDPIKKFRDEVELMSINEIQTAIDSRTSEMNGHTTAADEHRRYLRVLHEEKRGRLVSPPPSEERGGQP